MTWRRPASVEPHWAPSRVGARGGRWHGAVWRVAIASFTLSVSALAQDEATDCDQVAERVLRDEPQPPPPRSELSATPVSRALAGRYLGTVALGRGLRLNNPYRLATPLGRTPESLSLTATYLDLALSGTLVRPPSVEHGLVVHLSVALEGVGQQTLTPSYVQLRRASPRWLVLARAGVPVVVSPDVNAGLEGALGALYFASAGMGITTEVVGSMFYGAATRERDPTGIPVISLQVGAFLNHEVLP